MKDQRFSILYRRLVRSLVPAPGHRERLLRRLMLQQRLTDRTDHPKNGTKQTGE